MSQESVDNGHRAATASFGFGRTWNTETAAGALVLGSLGFIFLVRHGFRGVLVNLGA